MAITLFDLAAADPAVRFSPYCWRTRLALAHKGLPVDTIPWRFTETAKLPAGWTAGTVPVLVDDARSVGDSWTIALDLEERYPDQPSLFGGPAGLAHARFINAWADTVLLPLLARLILPDVARIIAPQDQTYFRESREGRFKKTFQQMATERDQHRDTLARALDPLRRTLKGAAFLGGAAPSYADYIVLGTLQWPYCVNGYQVMTPDEVIADWLARGRQLFDGLLADAKRAEAA